MRDSEKGGKKPIEAVEKLRTRKAKLERVTQSTTKKEKPQESLQRQKDFYKAVMENTFFGFTLIDRDYIIVLANSMESRLFRKPVSELIGKKCFREFEKRDAVCPYCPGAQAMATGRPEEVETEKVRDDGSRFPVCIQAFPNFDSDGAVTGFVEIVHDITERKKVGEEVKALKQQLEFILGATKTGLDIIDSEFNIRFIDPEWKKIYGEPTGKKCYEYFMDRSEVCSGCGIVKALETKTVAVTEEVLVKENNRPIQVITIPFQDEKGEWLVAEVNVDITERKKAEEEIRLSKEKFVKAFNSSPAAIFIITLKEGQFKEINESGLKIFGYRREEVVRHTSKELNMWVDYRDREIMIKKLEKEGSVRDLQVSMRRKSGEVFDALISVDTIDIEGEPCLISTATDISEHKKAEEALKKSEEKFRNIFENSNVGISVTSLDGTLNANTVFCDMLGYSKEELSRVKWTDITLQEDIALSNNYLGQLRSGKKKSVRFQKRYVKKDGSIIFADASVTLQKDKDGKPPYYITTIMDITERKKAEEALLESEEKWRSLVKNAPNMIIIVNRDSTIQFINRTVPPLTIEDAIGKSIYDYIEPGYQNVIRETIDYVFQTGEPGRCEIRGVGPNDRTSWYETQAGPIKRDEQIVAATLITTDITERKKTEETLRLSEEKFAKAFNSSPAAILITTLKEGRFIDLNEIAISVYGYTREEVVGHTAKELNMWANYNDRDIVVQSIRRGNAVLDMETRFRRRSGEVFDSIISVDMINIGGTECLISTIVDITERKNMEEALRRNEARYRSSIELTSQLAWTTDSNGEVVEDIPLWRKFTGLSYEETKGSGWTKALHPEDAEHTRQVWGKAVKDKKAYEVEYRLRRFDGVYQDFLTRGIPVFKEDGSIREWVGVNIDITERKEVEETLRESEERYRKQFEDAIDAMVLADPETGMIIDCNIAATKLVEREKSEIIGKHQSFLHSAEDIIDGLSVTFKSHVTGKASELLEDRVITKSGQIKDVSVGASKITIAGKEVIQGIFRDITERKKSDQKIYDYQQRLKALSSQLSLIEERAKRKIAAGLHDNIGQKLAVAKLELQSLMMSTPDTKMSDSINSMCGEITHIIDDVRSLTFEIGNPLLDEIGLTAALEKYITEEIQAKFGIECELIDEAGAQDLEETVRTVLYRSTRELLINSVKYAKAHNIKVRIYQSAGNIHVCVEDDGVGFEVSKIASLPTKTGGFGLFSIKEQLEYIGGNLQVKSGVGHGTKVTIDCPPKLKPAFA